MSAPAGQRRAGPPPLPADAWRSVSLFCGVAGLARLRTGCRDGVLAHALESALGSLGVLDLSSPAPLLSIKALRALLLRCRGAEAVCGLQCLRLAPPTGLAGDELGQASRSPSAEPAAAAEPAPPRRRPRILPALPATCRRLGLRLADSWSFEECARFLSSAGDWVSAPLEQLSLAWNPPDDTTIARLVLDTALFQTDWSGGWQLSTLTSLSVHRCPSALGFVVLSRALECQAPLRSVQIPDMQLPDSSSDFWRHLEEFTLYCQPDDEWYTDIDDSLFMLLSQAKPPLKTLRLTDARSPPLGPSHVTARGIRALRPLLGQLTDLKLRRMRGQFCDVNSIELLMLLSGALSANLRRLDLEGFPQLSDACLLEMLRSTRSGEGTGIESLRLLRTPVTDLLFMNGFVDALAPALKELRLSGGGPQLGDPALRCLAEAGRCKGLERLTVGSRSFGDVGLSAAVAGARNLQALFLHETAVSDDFLARLAKEAPLLEELGISGCQQVTNAGLQALHDLPLASLRLDGCSRIYNRHVAELLRRVGPTLSSLSLERCNCLTHQCLVELGRGARWARLSNLRLLGLKISGAMLSWCSANALPALRKLEVWRENAPRNFGEHAEAFKLLRPEVILSMRVSVKNGGTLGWENW